MLDPDTGVLYQNRGSYFSLEPDHPNVLEPGKRPLHTLLPGMLFRDGVATPWVVAGAAGGDAQPQIHAQLVSALVDGGVDVADRDRAPRWFVEPGAHFEPPVEVRLEPRFVPGVGEALEALGHPVTADRHRSTRCSGRSTPSSWSAAARPTPMVRWRRPPTRAATGCPGSGDAVAFGPLCDTRAAGGGLRSHDAATGPACRSAPRSDP